MTHLEITKKMIQLGLGAPDTSDFAIRQTELDKHCQAVSGEGLTPATGIGAQFNPQPELTIEEMAKMVGCTEAEMREFIGQ